MRLGKAKLILHVEGRLQSELSSYRRILWATSVIGGATLASLVIGLARNKAVALIGGPAAVGLLGLFMSIVSMGASVATLGIDTSAVRQIAHYSENPAERARTQRAVWSIAWPLALIGAAGLWFLSNFLAQTSAGSVRYAPAIGWLSIAVGATVIAATQMALIQAHGRIGDLAKSRLWGSALATAIGVGAVFFYGLGGIVVAVVAGPLVTCFVAFWFGRTLPSSAWPRFFETRMSDQWRVLISLGAVVTLTNSVSSVSQLGTRSLVTRALGLDAAGFYHASWSITWVNLSLVLNAMAADYFPRIAKVAREPQSISKIFNQQVHVALLFAAPALAVVSTVAPLVLEVLYSGAFSRSALLLRLLLIAGVLRLPIWAMGYVLLARRAVRSYFLGEVAAASIIPLTWLLLPVAGLTGAGIAAVLSALASFFAYLVPLQRSHCVRLSFENARMIALLVFILSAIAGVSQLSAMAGNIVGGVTAVVLAWRLYRGVRVVF